MKTNNLISKAAQQALSEILGYEEGRMYFLLLSGSTKKYQREFSYSKRYRLLKNLFHSGFMAKFRPEGKEFFNYLILPPSVLVFYKTEQEIIKFLEGLYFKNHLSSLKRKFSQIILKEERGLVLFLLKYVMKENAKLVMNKLNIPLDNIDEIRHKVIFKESRSTKRKLGVIDGRLAFEFTSIEGMNNQDYIGYVAYQSEKICNKFTKHIEEETN